MTVCNSVNELPEELKDIYFKAMAEFKERGVFFLEDAYILDIQNRFSPYPKILTELLEGAKALRADGEYAFYALFTFRVLIRRELYKKFSHLFDFDDVRHPYLAFFILLPTVENTFNTLTKRNIPTDIIKNVLCHYEECVFIYEERVGRRGMNKRYFDWLGHYVDCEMLNIDRLRFEIRKVGDPVYIIESRLNGERILLYCGGEMKADGLCKDTPPYSEDGFKAEFFETDEEIIAHRVLENGRCSPKIESFKKSEYSIILSPDDMCLGVHIPPKSKGKFTKEICLENYKRAVSVFKEHYPEYSFKAIRCESWMLSQELCDILDENSNILGFQKSYRIYPVPSKGEDVFNFVFKLKFKSFRDMPEDTSLQRSIKKLYLDGKYVYEYGGIFLTDEL